ncbi:unnamed protein product [Schistocephalus solidus]|uniref:Phosphotransferase n=1 Tax=Schistocephalus solidus TaxID=70667 RepID=A0A183TEZ6_SCHSO|nr:unnamed protein product [Schistocephalus solidus]
MDVLTDEEIFDKVKERLSCFELKQADYANIRKNMNNAMLRGLNIGTRDKASVKMYPSFVTKLPNGTEAGQYLALDLGGTNYRVILVTLAAKEHPPKIEERTYAIPRETMTSTGEELFEYIATTLQNFLKRFGIADKEMKLGFTFSFPCEQYGLNEAILVRWTKGFDARDAVGKDVACLLQKAIDKTGLKVQCVAVVNDTVGTLASCALEDRKCAIGLIVGTGTNAAYIEKSENVPFMHQILASRNSPPITDESVIINMEWGAFGEEGDLDTYLTPYDKLIDKESLHPGKQIFEKMVSGMYLGELVRLIILDLVDQKLLFRGDLPESLKTCHSFPTKYITETERDPPHLFYSTHYMLTEDLNVPIVEPIDDRVVRYACEIVARRAAYLAGAGIAALLHKLDRKHVTVGIDGSLYKFHTRFREYMTDIIDKLRPEGIQARAFL